MTWQPIDTAPVDGTEILASDYDTIDIVRWEPRAFGLFPAAWVNRREHVMFPTHWQPLPSPPSPPGPARPAHWQPLPDHPPLPEQAP